MLDPIQTCTLIPDLMEIVANSSLRSDLNERLGDYCHHYRNRLNSLKLSLYLVQRQSPRCGDQGWRALEANYQAIETRLDHVQTLCQPFTLSLTSIQLGLLFEDRRVRWANLLAAANQELVFQSSQPSRMARFDVDRLGAALDAVVAWRGAQGAIGSTTTVNWMVQHGQAQIRWTEAASSQLRPAPIPVDHSQWALPILTRVVQEHGGIIKLDEGAGWEMQITWPTAAEA